MPYKSKFKGHCSYAHGGWDIIEEPYNIASAMDCYYECTQKTGCIAFTFKKDDGWCRQYRNGSRGPYTHGGGGYGIDCYILGISNLFNAVIHMKFVKVIICVIKRTLNEPKPSVS